MKQEMILTEHEDLKGLILEVCEGYHKLEYHREMTVLEKYALMYIADFKINKRFKKTEE